jgi:hypothetical protein
LRGQRNAVAPDWLTIADHDVQALAAIPESALQIGHDAGQHGAKRFVVRTHGNPYGVAFGPFLGVQTQRRGRLGEWRRGLRA